MCGDGKSQPHVHAGREVLHRRVEKLFNLGEVDDLSIERQSGLYTARITIPEMVLTPGFYYFTSGIYAPGTMSVFDERENAVSIEILDGGSLLANFGIKSHAATMIPLRWETTSDS